MAASNAFYALIGSCLAVFVTLVLTGLRPASGDPTIQPEGEPDPGKRD